LFDLSFNHKDWGKTTTKTEEDVPAAGLVPAAKCATTGEPGTVVPSTPTNTNSFHFSDLSFNHKDWGKTTTKTDEALQTSLVA